MLYDTVHVGHAVRKDDPTRCSAVRDARPTRLLSGPAGTRAPITLMPRSGEGPCFFLNRRKGGEEVDAWERGPPCLLFPPVKTQEKQLEEATNEMTRWRMCKSRQALPL